MKRLRRCHRSKTINFSAILVVLGTLQTQSEYLATLLTAKQHGAAMALIGLVVAYLRYITTTDLADK